MGFENGKGENRTEREVMCGTCFHRFKKFIKDVVNGTIERDDVIHEEIINHLNEASSAKNAS